MSAINPIGSSFNIKAINKNSKQYQAAVRDSLGDIMTAEAAMSPVERQMYEMFGGRERIMQNKMQMYDANGNRLNGFGVAGMDRTGVSETEAHQIIDVPASARQKMFDETKRHFIQEGGIANGDTTRRTEVFKDFQVSAPVQDRLKGTWTLGQYERQYRQAFYDACKAVDPSWELGKSVPEGALKNITRESIDSSLVKSGNQLIRKGVDVKA